MCGAANDADADANADVATHEAVHIARPTKMRGLAHSGDPVVLDGPDPRCNSASNNF